MAKLRKTLGHANSPYILSLMNLIETQSKETLCKWCISYCKEVIVPIYEKQCPNDNRIQKTLDAANLWLDGKVKLQEVKKLILEETHEAARSLDDNPIAQAAARSCGQAAACIHTPTHSLGFVFYALAAIAYNQVGLNETNEVYEKIALIECAKIEKALQDIAVINEENPAKINWKC